jgi:hypothetical protein
MIIIDQFVHISTLSIYEANYLMSVEEKRDIQHLSEQELLERFKLVGKVSENVLEQLSNSPEYQDI